MTPLLISAFILLGVPAGLLYVFRSNAAIMFLAACAGIVLLGSLDPNVVATAGAFVPGEGEAYTRLSVVFLSIGFAAMMFRGTIKKPSGYLLHGLLILIMAFMLWTSLPFVTGISWLIDSTEQSHWSTIEDYRTFIIALGLSLSLVVLLRSGKTKH